MDNLGELRGGRTGVYRRDIAHFLGAWLPDNPGETRTGQRRIWIAASIHRKVVDLSYRTRAGLAEMGVICFGGFPRPGIRFKQSSCRLSQAGLVEKSCRRQLWWTGDQGGKAAQGESQDEHRKCQGVIALKVVE